MNFNFLSKKNIYVCVIDYNFKIGVKIYVLRIPEYRKIISKNRN